MDDNNVVSFRNNFLGTGSKLDTAFGISFQTFDNGNLHNATEDNSIYTKLKEVGSKYYAISLVGNQTNRLLNIVIGIYDPKENSTTQITGNEIIQITNDVVLKLDKDGVLNLSRNLFNIGICGLAHRFFDKTLNIKPLFRLKAGFKGGSCFRVLGSKDRTAVLIRQNRGFKGIDIP